MRARGADHAMGGVGPKGHHCNIKGIVHLWDLMPPTMGSMDPDPSKWGQIQDPRPQIPGAHDLGSGPSTQIETPRIHG